MKGAPNERVHDQSYPNNSNISCSITNGIFYILSFLKRKIPSKNSLPIRSYSSTLKESSFSSFSIDSKNEPMEEENNYSHF